MCFSVQHTSLRVFRDLAALLFLSLSVSASADPIISEVLASNKAGLTDDDGEFSDWIEIFNPDDAPVNLGGWSLTDNVKNRTKWKFPAVSVAAQGYLVVFASNKDRADPARPLHTNFALDADGEYLALIKPDGSTAAAEFLPAFPPQVANISYGITQSAGEAAQWGYFAKPTPAKTNAGAGGLTLIHQVTFSSPPAPFTGSLSLTLSGAGAGETIRYVLGTPSATVGAALDDPTSASTEYTSPLTLTQATVIRAAVFSADGARRGAVSAAQYVPLDVTTDARLDGFNSQLPVLVLDDHGLGELVKDEIDHPSWFSLWRPNSEEIAKLTALPTLVTPMLMSVRGASSAIFPKKSWKIELNDALGKKAPQALFGFPSNAEWNVIGYFYFDPSLIRSPVAYALSNQIGRWAARTEFVEVFFNHNGGALDATDYAGVYAVTDKMEVGPDRVAVAPLAATDVDAASITGGYLLKIDDPDPERFSWRTSRNFPSRDLAVSLIVDSPKLSKLSSAQSAYIKDYVQQFEDALYGDQQAGWTTRKYLEFIDRPSWVDHHLLNTFLKNTDAFWRSSYFTKDRNAKLAAGPIWDFDRSMGSVDGRDANTDTWGLETNTLNGPVVDYWGFGWWGVLAQDADFRQGWVDRWQTLRRSQFADENLTAVVDKLAATIGPAAAARDASKWWPNQSRFGDHAGEIAHLRDWLLRRAKWIDAQFIAAPMLLASGDQISLSPPTGAELVYTLDGSDPRGADGKPSPTAIVTTQGVTLAAFSKVNARAYRADHLAFPSTPWSGLAAASGASISSPSSPARLVNLSSRARISAGTDVVIAGFVVADAAAKPLLARAVGPTLGDFGVLDALADPVLRVVRADGTEVASNAAWSEGSDAAQVTAVTARVGGFPLLPGSRDAALLLKLPAGAYSMHVSSGTQTAGTSLVELYETDEVGSAINISSRAEVRPDGPLIAGFVINGTAPRRLLIRGVGPALGSAGVPNPLSDPMLSLHRGDAIIATNNDWGTAATSADIVSVSAQAGAFSLADGSRDAVLLVTLAPGTYSAVVKSQDNGSGSALVEVYEVH